MLPGLEPKYPPDVANKPASSFQSLSPPTSRAPTPFSFLLPSAFVQPGKRRSAGQLWNCKPHLRDGAAGKGQRRVPSHFAGGREGVRWGRVRGPLQTELQTVQPAPRSYGRVPPKGYVHKFPWSSEVTRNCP